MKSIFFILIFLLTGVVFSQNEASKDLKVGLVLSGGGAKGLAHIGVLKAIEEAGVRIDYIGGTSMGAIVGALYASGYSVKQLDSIFSGVDYNTIIQDDIPRKAKTFYEKTESEKYALTLPFDNFKVSFPSGLSKGQNVYNLMSKLTAHVNHINDFGKLPIPFFCVATDVETGKMVILDKGYLPRAVTASGALPSLFSPVMVDDKLLVDGGVVNNYPVDEVRAKGMDVIIGVDVQDGLKDRSELKSIFDVMVQINTFRTVNEMETKRAKTDIYIHPEIEDFTVVSFSESGIIMETGAVEAVKFREDLEELSAQQKHLPKKKIKFLERNSFYITNVEIKGNEKYTRAYVLGKLKLKVPAEVTYEEFSEGVNNLSATGSFQDIDYRIIPEGNGKFNVLFTLRENKSNTFLRFGAHYDELYLSAALINITKKRFITNNDIASFDLGLGDNLRYNFNYYVDKGFYWSIGFNSSFNTFNKDVEIGFVAPELLEDSNSEINKINLEYMDLTNQVYIETLFKRTFLLGGGLEQKWIKYLSETIGIDENNKPRTVFENSNYFNAFGYLKLDTYDNSFFPKSGVYFNGDFRLYLLAAGMNKDFDSFSIAKAKFGYARSFFKNLSGVLTTEGGLKIGNNGTNSFDFFLGGYGYKVLNNIMPLYGYEALTLRGNTYIKTNITFDYEFLKKNHLNLSANIAKVGDNLFASTKWIDSVNYIGYAIGYGLETFFGPLEVKYSFSPEREAGEWHINAGFRF
jgi:NTE family protein